MRSKILIPLVLGALALGAGLWLGLQILSRGAPLEIAGVYLNEPQAITADFTLTDSASQPFTKDSFKGKWSFLYFGYTYCPDACPLTLTQLNALEKQLAAQGLNQDTAYLLISVDPGRDTPERLGEYTRYFNPKFQGATGAPEELAKIAQQFGVYYSVPEDTQDPDYLVDHSSMVFLVNPDAQLQALFSAPHEPAKLAADFTAIRQRFAASR
jgi:protein SCO1/2